MSRRFFIGGAVLAGAFGGCRMFEAPLGSCAGGKPNLRMGVISDVHLLSRIAWPLEFCELRGDEEIFRQTLRYFRDQNVDAVMITGDIADYGMVDELELAMEVWREVFPDDRAPDGHKVERLWVSGNHEINGHLYDDYAKLKFPDQAECARHCLRADWVRNWSRITGEPYSHFFAKEVKGYRFLSTHWGFDAESANWTNYGKGGNYGEELKAYLEANGSKLDPSRPFFYFQHPHLKGTCFAPWCWGADTGVTTEVLRKFPNAVSFSGHAHYPITDERAIWQQEFTAVALPSLKFLESPCQAHGDFGYENSYRNWAPKEKTGESQKTTNAVRQGTSPQGTLVDVYDDRIVVSRREFPSAVPVGADWVIPLASERPFAYAARAKKSAPPEFAADAAVTVRPVRRRTRGDHPVEKDCVELTFPPARAGGSRVFEYEIAAIGSDGVKKAFNLLAFGYNRPPDHAETKAPTVMSISLDRLPARPIRFEVVPKDCWWNRGKAIVGSFA